MALSRLPFVNLSWAYYRFDSPLVRRFDPFIHDHPIDHPPFIRPSIRWIWNVVAGCNGRLISPLSELQIPPRSISSVVPRNGMHLSIDPFGRINTFEATPHKNRAKFDSGYRFSIRAENCVKLRELRSSKSLCILTRVRSTNGECLSCKRGEGEYVWLTRTRECLFIRERRKRDKTKGTLLLIIFQTLRPCVYSRTERFFSKTNFVSRYFSRFFFRVKFVEQENHRRVY